MQISLAKAGMTIVELCPGSSMMALHAVARDILTSNATIKVILYVDLKLTTQVLSVYDAYCVNQSINQSITFSACSTHQCCAVSVALSHVSDCVCRCGTILCDSLLWQAPCSSASGHEAKAMEVEGTAASGNSKPLLRSHVEDYCDVIVEGMKVGLACCLA